MQQRDITLEQKLKYLQEVESIYRLSKKVLPPKGKTWKQVADQILRKALGAPVVNKTDSINVTKGRQMHLHSPRTARMVERTLKSEMHPDLLHSYRGDNVSITNRKMQPVRELRMPTADQPDVMHVVQHGATDVQYPGGHMQGFGFVPRTHEVAAHVQVEQKAQGSVPAATPAYH